MKVRFSSYQERGRLVNQSKMKFALCQKGRFKSITYERIICCILITSKGQFLLSHLIWSNWLGLFAILGQITSEVVEILIWQLSFQFTCVFVLLSMYIACKEHKYTLALINYMKKGKIGTLKASQTLSHRCHKSIRSLFVCQLVKYSE